MSKDNFLDELIRLFDQSKQTYRQYLAEGKTFRYARELKHFNDKTLGLLKEKHKVFDKSLTIDIDQLINHYEEWSKKWEALAASGEFSDDDVFVFANDAVFPREAANHIEQYYQQLK